MNTKLILTLRCSPPPPPAASPSRRRRACTSRSACVPRTPAPVVAHRRRDLRRGLLAAACSSKTAARATSATRSPSRSSRRPTRARSRRPTPAARSNNNFGVTALAGPAGQVVPRLRRSARPRTSRSTAKARARTTTRFTGTITVTVTEVLPNGNLLVSGEKQVGINQGSEFIRLSGVVNPIAAHRDATRSSRRSSPTRASNTAAAARSPRTSRPAGCARFFLNVLPF